MSLSNQRLVKTIPLYSIPSVKEQSDKDCSLSNGGKNGKKVEIKKNKEVLDAETEALQKKKEILKQAEKEKEAILKEALKEAEKVKKESKQMGYNLGYEEGLALGEAKIISDYEEQVERLKQETANQYRSFVSETNQSLTKEKEWVIRGVVELVESSLKKLLHDAEAIKADRVEKIVRSLSTDLLGCGFVAIRVHSDKVSEINKVLDETGILDGKRNVRVTTDPLLKEHDCLIETENETLEFNLESELESLIKEIERVSQ